MQVNIRQNGTDLPSVQHERQAWVVAPPEGEYEIVIFNNSNDRKLAVVTVDGLSAMDGQEGKKDGNGYVVEPWQRLVVPGWRRSDREVARFTFTPNEGSYSSKMGKGTRNTGVIAVAVFEEKAKPVVVQQPVIVERPVFIREVYPPWYTRPWYPGPVWCSTTEVIGSSVPNVSTVNAVHSVQNEVSMSTVSASASASSEPHYAGLGKAVVTPEDTDLGTGYGQRAEMRTQAVPFERASSKPSEVIVIRYGLRERLARLGVPVDQAVRPNPAPNPFPGSNCPAPADWAG